jgi:hypothetical protein
MLLFKVEQISIFQIIIIILLIYGDRYELIYSTFFILFSRKLWPATSLILLSFFFNHKKKGNVYFVLLYNLFYFNPSRYFFFNLSFYKLFLPLDGGWRVFCFFYVYGNSYSFPFLSFLV